MSTDADVPSIVDALADDAQPPEYPNGAPLLQPFLRIRPRSKRAEFKRRYAEFADAEKTLKALQARISGDTDDSDPGRNADRMRVWADMDDYMQKMVDLMELAAVNPDAYQEWADAATDEELVAVFTVYVKRSQPGEVSRSAT